MAGSAGMNEQKKKTPGPFGPGHHEKRLIFDYNKLIGFCFSNFLHVFPADNFIFLERSVNVLLNLTLKYIKNVINSDFHYICRVRYLLQYEFKSIIFCRVSVGGSTVICTNGCPLVFVRFRFAMRSPSDRDLCGKR